MSGALAAREIIAICLSVYLVTLSGWEGEMFPPRASGGDLNEKKRRKEGMSSGDRFPSRYVLTEILVEKAAKPS